MLYLLLVYTCKKCGVAKPHTKEYFYEYGKSPKNNQPYIRLTCIACDLKTAFINRKVRQGIAKVDRFERKLIRTISNQVAKEMGKAQKVTIRQERLNLERDIKNAHKEAIKENQKRDHAQMWVERKAATKERQQQRKREWRANNRELTKQKRRERLANETPEERAKRLLFLKEYRETNREYYRRKSSEWNRKNPEKAVRAVLRRRAKKRNNGYEIYTTQQVLDLYGTNCYICATPIDIETSRKVGSRGWKLSLQVDHVIPISKGGPDTLDNVRPAHAICNMEKRDRMPEELNLYL
jgi:5-methylcytosine-specific restriction endonuclease McrA